MLQLQYVARHTKYQRVKVESWNLMIVDINIDIYNLL